MKCAAKNCNNDAFTAYGYNWVCGNCLLKIIEKEKERKNKEIEDL